MCLISRTIPFRVFCLPKLPQSLHDIIDSQASPTDLFEQRGKRWQCWLASCPGIHRPCLNSSPLTWKKWRWDYLQFLHRMSCWSFSGCNVMSLRFWYFAGFVWNWPLLGENGLKYTQINNMIAYPIFLHGTKPSPAHTEIGTQRFLFQ